MALLSRIVMLMVIAQSAAIKQLNILECQNPLGLESGAIPNSAISASSTYDASVGPLEARLHIGNSAWCPRNFVDMNPAEFLQIDFGKLMVVTQMATSGRFERGLGKEYASHFRITYLRENEEWMNYKDRNNEMILPGNSNTYSVQMNILNPPITARKIRIIPLNEVSRAACVKVELYGCERQDGLVSYSAPLGQVRNGVNLIDQRYDGLLRISPNPMLYDGMGQLADGKPIAEMEEGEISDFVGWSKNIEPVILTFKFQGLRRFHSLEINVDNNFENNTRVFQQALIYFSFDGLCFSQEKISFTYLQDDVFSMPRTIKIMLNSRTGKYVRVELYHDNDKWIVIREMFFNSEPVSESDAAESIPSCSQTSLTTTSSSAITVKTVTLDVFRVSVKTVIPDVRHHD